MKLKRYDYASKRMDSHIIGATDTLDCTGGGAAASR